MRLGHTPDAAAETEEEKERRVTPAYFADATSTCT